MAVTKISSEDWDDLNREVRIDLEKCAKITRVDLHQYTVAIYIGGLVVSSYFKIEAWQGDVLQFEVAADYRERSSVASWIGEFVGKTVSACTCSDIGIRMSVCEDYVLIFRRDEGESFEIHSETIFPSVF